MIEVLKTVGQFGSVGGIALGVFLLLFRDVIRKHAFPTLTKRQAFSLLGLILVLTWSVALAGMGTWVYLAANQKGKEPPNKGSEAGPNVTATTINARVSASNISGSVFVNGNGNSVNFGVSDQNIPAFPEVKLPTIWLYSPANILLGEEMPSNDVLNCDEKFLRLQILKIINSNNIPLLNFSCRIQYPEAIVYTYPKINPPGVEIAWHKSKDVRVLGVQGSFFVKSKITGIEDVSPLYTLEFNNLPPGKSIEVDFLTSTRPELKWFYQFPENHMPNPQSGLFDSDTSQIVGGRVSSPFYYYLSGGFQYGCPTGIVSEDFFAPVVEKTDRTILLPNVQKGTGGPEKIIWQSTL